MLLHSQKSLYYADGEEITNLTDMVLVAINEVTKMIQIKEMMVVITTVWIFQIYRHLTHI